MFSTLLKTNSIFCVISNLPFVDAFNLGMARLLSSGKGLTLPKLFQTERAGDNFNYKNCRKFSKLVENARYEQFLLFPQCYQKTLNADT